MKDIIKNILLAINAILLAELFIYTIFIFYCEFFGYDKGDDFLASINFPFDSRNLTNISFVCLGIILIVYFIRIKFFK